MKYSNIILYVKFLIFIVKIFIKWYNTNENIMIKEKEVANI